MSALRKNVAGQHISFCLNSSAAGAPVTAGGAGNVVIDGGAQAACAGVFTHKGTGQWDYAPTQAETNGTSVGFAFTGTGAIQVGMTFFTIGYDPTQAQVPANVTQVLGIASAGAAGSVSVDWAQTVNKTSVVDFTQTTIKNLDGNTVQTGDAFARLGAPVGISTSADIAAVKTDLDAGVNTTKFAGQNVVLDANNLPKVDVEDINGNAVAAQALNNGANANPWGTCSGGTVNTAIVSAINNPATITDASQLQGRVIIFLGSTATAGLQAQAAVIASSTAGATPTITFSAPMTRAPAAGDKFIIV